MKNEQIKEAQEAKKREVEKKKKEMEEQRQAELKRKLDTEMAAKKAATSQVSIRKCVMCVSRKYPYPSHRRLFGLNSRNSSLAC